MVTYSTKGTCSKQLLKGIRCKQNTSCPDQLAQALEPYTEAARAKKA